ncbi:adenylyltransferase/cytidyltransferase family protein [Halobacillus naozhouensis]|uniref:Riboflavin biosynthesis protein n=1 Tax=Halobacillus naozhouensis TaxID=554880 RepID=A0ABY8IYM1_9BACI|nr:adenylyltransferase/cytidyltransferase family protein [Halobacillus naozhouensis]WFT75300.1 adenylyltransferase/cytidyltransferase family protein [Halobacillus naozhouensis]
MEIVRLTHPLKESLSPKESHVMAVGFFDGVHLGHQDLIKQAKRIADQENRTLTAMTFDPHPDEVIKEETDRKYLTPLPAKAERLARFGCEKLFVVSFDKAFASLPPADFINDYVISLNTKNVVVGFDFTFGYKAKGDTEYLQKKSLKKPFNVTVIPKKTYDKEKISSTLLKSVIREGHVHLVPYYLGKHYEVIGHINTLRSRGKTIKVDPIGRYLLPKPGLYQVQVKDGKRTLQGLFRLFPSIEEESEITVNGLIDPHVNKISIQFTNEISSTAMISG